LQRLGNFSVGILVRAASLLRWRSRICSAALLRRDDDASKRSRDDQNQKQAFQHHLSVQLVNS
jgi:hypothetical protein